MYSRAVQVLALVSGSLAQSQQFLWGFTNQISTSLVECAALPLTVQGVAVNGTPPFYMISYAAGAAPVTQFIGTNASALSWTVPHPVGTQLILGVVDSLGTPGGTDTPLYTVIAGTSTCIPAPSTDPPFTVSSTSSDNAVLNTCDPWNLFITGGKPPYEVTIAELNTPFVTNSSMGPTDTVFQYINRGTPDSQMIAAISDSTGRWATGSPIVKTNGSTDLSCPGRSTVSGTNATISTSLPPINPSSTLPNTPSSTGSSSTSSPAASSSGASTSPSSGGGQPTWRTIAIVCGTIGGSLVLLASLAAFCWCRRRHPGTPLSLSPVNSPTWQNTPVSPFLTISSPTRATASSVNLHSPADATPTPFVLPDRGSRWSKANKFSDGFSSSGAGSSSAGGMGINMRDLPPPYNPYAENQ